MIVTALVIGGIVVGSMLIAGCDSEEDDNPAGVPEDSDAPFKGPVASRDAFAKPEALHQFDDISYTTMKYSLPESLIMGSTPAWQPRARLYFGATEEIFRPIHEGRESGNLAPELECYVGAMNDFFEGHYDVADARHALAHEDGVLVLVGGLAPLQPCTVGALDLLGSKAVGQGEFVRVLKAGYYYNRAAEVAQATDRFTSSPEVAKGISAAERDEALGYLETAQGLLSGIDPQEPAELDDRQIEFLILKDAARGLRESLEGIKDKPKCKLRPSDCGPKKRLINRHTRRCKCVPNKEKSTPGFQIPNPGKY